MSMALADMVEARLREEGHSRRWLAREIGVAPQTINNLLNGMRPDVATLEKLAKYLDKPLNVLLRLVGMVPAEHLEEEEIERLVGDDWTVYEMVTLMRGLKPEDKKRLLQIAKLHVGAAEQ
jgi:transcriptional regulator with XRE-family HTH domain